MQQRYVSPWASSKLHGTGLKCGGFMGDEGGCASRGEMGESESVSPREVLFKVGGGGGETLGGGDR